MIWIDLVIVPTFIVELQNDSPKNEKDQHDPSVRCSCICGRLFQCTALIIDSHMILPMIRTIESEGYHAAGDVFISMVLGDSGTREEDLSTVEFEISER